MLRGWRGCASGTKTRIFLKEDVVALVALFGAPLRTHVASVTDTHAIAVAGHQFMFTRNFPAARPAAAR